MASQRILVVEVGTTGRTWAEGRHDLSRGAGQQRVQLRGMGDNPGR